MEQSASWETREANQEKMDAKTDANVKEIIAEMTE
jgi:hypothetical protein